jgi:hypothetical protein
MRVRSRADHETEVKANRRRKAARKEIIVHPIKVFPGPRTPAQEAALAAFWAGILARPLPGRGRD